MEVTKALTKRRNLSLPFSLKPKCLKKLRFSWPLTSSEEQCRVRKDESGFSVIAENNCIPVNFLKENQSLPVATQQGQLAVSPTRIQAVPLLIGESSSTPPPVSLHSPVKPRSSNLSANAKPFVPGSQPSCNAQRPCIQLPLPPISISTHTGYPPYAIQSPLPGWTFQPPPPSLIYQPSPPWQSLAPYWTVPHSAPSRTAYSPASNLGVHSPSSFLPLYSVSPSMGVHSPSSFLPLHSVSPSMGVHSPSSFLPLHSVSPLMGVHSPSSAYRLQFPSSAFGTQSASPGSEVKSVEKVQLFSLPAIPVEGCRIDLRPSLSDTRPENEKTEYDWQFNWYRNQSSVVISTESRYTPKREDIGWKLRVECTPICQITHKGLYPAGVAKSDQTIEFPQLIEREVVLFEEMTVGCFKVLTYNALSKNNLTEQNYPDCPDYARDWWFRRELLAREIEKYDADIVCLQEDHGIEELSEGCPIFFKADTFVQAKRTKLSFSAKAKVKFPHEHLNYSSVHVAFFLKLQLITDSNVYIIVGNTHLPPASKSMDRHKIFQVGCLLEELQKLGEGITPVILCGDLNFKNQSLFYQLLVDKAIRDQHFRGNFVATDIELKSVYKCLDEANSNNPKVRAQKPFLNKGEPKWTHSWLSGAVDYVFFLEEKLECLGVLELLSKTTVGSIPSEIWPSDHLAIMGVLRLKNALTD